MDETREDRIKYLENKKFEFMHSLYEKNSAIEEHGLNIDNVEKFLEEMLAQEDEMMDVIQERESLGIDPEDTLNALFKRFCVEQFLRAKIDLSGIRMRKARIIMQAKMDEWDKEDKQSLDKL
jgi:hypothetical protein